jgi:hypothetical protein
MLMKLSVSGLLLHSLYILIKENATTATYRIVSKLIGPRPLHIIDKLFIVFTYD